MPIHNMVGGGGAGLNLKVVGGTTQPASPAENTVWVNTPTAINGYAFSATVPTSPVAGMVWFKTASQSNAPINIDKKNTVLLYPTICKQYVSGAWVNKTAISYVNGGWKDWVTYLYNYGKSDFSFQFTTNTFSGGSGLADDHIHLVSTYKSQASAKAAMTPAVDLTPFSSAVIEMEAILTDGSGLTYVGFGKTNGTYNAAYYSAPTLTRQEIEIDISSLSGEYFFTAYRDSGAGEANIYSVYLR